MELRDYLRVIRARKWIIIQCAVIVTLSALLGSLLIQPKTFEGEAKVLISEKDTGAALFGTVLPELSSQPERGMQTQVQLIQLLPLAEKTVRSLNLQLTPEALLEQVQVSTIGQTNIVSVKATDVDPKRAADIANALAGAYVDWSRDTKRASIKAAADQVQSRLDQAQQQILDLGRKISAQGKTDQLGAELQLATGAYTTLASKLEELRVNEQLEIGSGQIVSPAVVAADPVSPRPVRDGAVALAIGLLGGVGLAFLFEYLDNTVKSDEEAERYYGVPVLVHIPFVKLEKGQEQHLAIVERPGSPAAEAYRVLRNSLDFINFEHKIKTLMVTSSAPGEGKSTVAANLAASLAQAGGKVVMVNCDFRRPTTDKFFGVPNIIGLSDVLLGTNSLKAALQRPGGEELLVLTSGKMPPNPSELLGSQKMQELVTSLEEWADWVIIDTPPLLAVSDGAAVARWADGVLMVSRIGTSTRETASKGAEMLANVGAKAVGVVITGSEASERGGAYYAGSAYYSHYASYYSVTDDRRAKKPADSGAKAPVHVKNDGTPMPDEWMPEVSPGRRFVQGLARVVTGLLAFLLVLIVAATVIYLLDQYFGWGVLHLVGLGL